jgi:hypothetical protein
VPLRATYIQRRMPLRAKIDLSKLPDMAVPQTNGTHANGVKPKTGIKVIIVGAGMTKDFHTIHAYINSVFQASVVSQQR